MGVEHVSCPTCDAAVRVGLPKGSTITAVKSSPERETTSEAKTRPLTCPNDHDFAVRFTI